MPEYIWHLLKVVFFTFSNYMVSELCCGHQVSLSSHIKPNLIYDIRGLKGMEKNIVFTPLLQFMYKRLTLT